MNDLNAVYFCDSYTGYAAGKGGTILKTINGGSSWNIQSSGVSVTLNSISFSDADHGYAVGDGSILKTTNGGTNWTIIKNGVYKQFLSVCFTNVNTGYIVEGYDSILRTQDGGMTWQNSYYPRGFLTSINFINSNTGFAMGEAGTLLKTTNGGSTWNQLSCGASCYLGAIAFTSPDTGYLVGSCGTILKTTNGGGYPVGVSELTTNPSPITVFPNPASTEITLETAPLLVPGYLIIYNLQGQPIITGQITEPKTQIDISTLPCGVYFVRVINDKTVEIGKFVKQ
jgi:photosystem II stability/assembly factor-like uncharacterized protein